MTWQIVALGEVAELLIGFAFKSTGFLDASSDGIKLVRGDNVQQGTIRWGEKAKKWPAEDFDDLSRFQLRLGDVILAMDRPIVGGGLKLAWIKDDDLPCLLVQRVCCVRGKEGIGDTLYLRYLLSEARFSAHIDRITTGANIPHISGKDIAAYSFRLPPIDEQRQIAKTIAAYDDLIENNQRRIHLLEEAARRLYREWIVPLRFPGHERVQVVEGVPQGWGRRTLGDVCDAAGGATPTTARADFWDGDITWLTPTDVTRNKCLFLADSARKITSAGLESCSSQLMPAGTIFMTSRASIGYFAILDHAACTNQGFISVVPTAMHSREFLLFHLMSRVEEFISRSTGSTFLELSKKTFRNMECVWPSNEVLERYSRQVGPMLKQIEVLKKQLDAAKAARDALLPRLMSGALAV